ncbi:hypothetical protein LY78DRAFT_20978 [Colletotrichum sublineola]|nr:hypothetical protein LY78DRAFT_20978 [Colletotrichum sublineola]
MHDRPQWLAFPNKGSLTAISRQPSVGVLDFQALATKYCTRWTLKSASHQRHLVPRVLVCHPSLGRSSLVATLPCPRTIRDLDPPAGMPSQPPSRMLTTTSVLRCSRGKSSTSGRPS